MRNAECGMLFVPSFSITIFLKKIRFSLKSMFHNPYFLPLNILTASFIYLSTTKKQTQGRLDPFFVPLSLFSADLSPPKPIRQLAKRRRRRGRALTLFELAPFSRFLEGVSLPAGRQAPLITPPEQGGLHPPSTPLVRIPPLFQY